MSTLEEIAQLSQVSRSTVSRVINNDPHVSDETREKVLAIVRELNYQPNAVARSLAAGRTRILGLIIPSGISVTFNDPFFPIFIQAVSVTCNALDYSVMLWLAEPDYEERMIDQVLRNGLLDGIIISSLHLPDTITQALIESKLPFVLIGQPASRDVNVSYVDVENRRGAREAVSHLLRCGHRRIAHIAGPQDTVPGQDRLQGYRDALRARGCRYDGDLVTEGDFTQATGYYGMKQLISQKPDALFAGNDVMAIGAIRALQDVGIEVPGQMAVVGFDDVPAAANSQPPLTTVRQPSQQMGIVATETLIDMIQHQETYPRRIVLPTELVIRQSCRTAAPR